MGVALITTDTGELRRETGYGRVDKVEHDARRNAHVRIDAEHLRQPVQGWADTEDLNLWPIVGRAHQEDLRVAYVVDVHRRRNVDAAIPFAELDRNDKVRDLVYLAIVDRSGTILSASAEHPPAMPAQEAATPAQGAQDGRQAPPEPNAPTEAPQAARRPQDGPANVCPECDAFPFLNAAELAEHMRDHVAEVEAATPPAEEEPPPAEPTRPEPAMRGRRGPKIAEAKPWEPHNSDGSLNLGSYAVTASLGFAELAYELVVERIRTDAAVRGMAMEAPSFPQVRALTRVLLRAADRVQANVRPDGRVDRMDASHTRARGAIRSVLDLYPVPWGATDEERTAWEDELVAQATELLRIGIALVDPEPEVAR